MTLRADGNRMYSNERALQIGRALRDCEEVEQFAKDKRGNVIAVIVPASHSRYLEVLKVLTNDAEELHGVTPEDYANVREFLSSEFYFLNRGRLQGPTYRLDVVYAYYIRWAEDHQLSPFISKEKLSSCIESLGGTISMATVSGIVVKTDVIRRSLSGGEE